MQQKLLIEYAQQSIAYKTGLQYYIEQGFPEWLSMDIRRFNQVLLNVVEHATNLSNKELRSKAKLMDRNAKVMYKKAT